MKFWFEMPDLKFVTIEYGRYEAVRFIKTGHESGFWTWTPVLAGPESPEDVLLGLTDEEYAQATCPV